MKEKEEKVEKDENPVEEAPQGQVEGWVDVMFPLDLIVSEEDQERVWGVLDGLKEEAARLSWWFQVHAHENRRDSDG